MRWPFFIPFDEDTFYLHSVLKKISKFAIIKNKTPTNY
jgi:hypothetical protein